ncbi:Gfo/Idh/MocA family protein [Portibacter lacus]|uniref:Oxidoreductase n=1 Tax=Portibacter lacus TaxID=1099794 RepID=A0AA37SVL1_9BACT|nr:Gfo/Idh/MocA family oxidoreductase [Portibacter lacus]GLR20035.1 oxidoreductase [Portibacter lacus]
MENKSRRSFLKKSVVTAGVFTIVPRFVLGRGFIAPSDKINIGVIGLGKQGNILSDRFIQNTQAQIIAGSDVWESKREAFQSNIHNWYSKNRGISDYKGLKTYLDYKELIDQKEVDAIIVATPDHWHAIQAVDVMDAGKDLYCEKPMTLTIDGGKKMVAAAKKNNSVVQIGSMQRSWDRFKKAKDLVSSGKLGEITKVLVNVGDPAVAYNLPAETIPSGLDWNKWCGPAPLIDYNELVAPPIVKTYPKWRDYKETGGGILADWGAHMFDIAQWCLDMDHTGPIKYIPPSDSKAVRGLRMFYANGIEMVHEDFGRKWAVRFIGTEGILDVSRGFLETNPTTILSSNPEVDTHKLYSKQWNHYQDWISAIKTRNQPICPVEIGHRSATVCNIANIAYELGQELNWDPEHESFINNDDANGMMKRKPRKF